MSSTRPLKLMTAVLRPLQLEVLPGIAGGTGTCACPGSVKNLSLSC